MNEDDLIDIRNIIDNLDEKIPKDGAVVQFDIYGGGTDESRIQANQKGYLRFGIELLKAAFAPTLKDKSGENTIDADIQYLTSENSVIVFDWFERKDDIPPPPKPKKPGGAKDALYLLFWAILVFSIIFFFAMGVLFTFNTIKETL